MITFNIFFKFIVCVYLQIVCFLTVNKKKELSDLCLRAKNNYHVRKIKILVKKIPDLNYSDNKHIPVEQSNPLMSACFNQNHQISDTIIKLLINHGADPEYQYADFSKNVITTRFMASSPLSYLIQTGRDTSIIKLIIDRINNMCPYYSHYPINCAVSNKNIEIIKYLISLNIDLTTTGNNPNIFHYLSMSKFSENELEIADILLNKNTKTFLCGNHITYPPLIILVSQRKTFNEYADLTKFYLLNGSSFVDDSTIYTDSRINIWYDIQGIEMIAKYDKLIFSPTIKNTTLLIQMTRYCNISKETLHIFQDIIYKTSLIGLINFTDSDNKTAHDYYTKRNLCLLDEYYENLLSGQITVSNTKSARNIIEQ